ncbi:MAG: type II toxin-antitoxin system HicB family antitoxin [Thermoanaerobaculia bacterium]
MPTELQAVALAMSRAVFVQLEDETFAGRIPGWPGVIAFGSSLGTCQRALQSTVVDWLRLGASLGHPLPSGEQLSIEG